MRVRLLSSLGESIMSLEDTVRKFSLYLKKTAYEEMNDSDKRQTKIDAYKRVQELKATGDSEDLKVAEMWQEYYEWICNYD